ncbi:MAG TPA: glycosyltransferase family 2 protein [Bryobacteraceae bacterium]|nr:glycosyltransferase family 2 protein [Bryobacteraceae bacterium]
MPNRKLDQDHVSVTIVTYNSRRYIRACLEAVLRQEGIPLEIVVVDNASTDGTPEILADFDGRIRTILNSRNLGFAAAQNQAIEAGSGAWVLALNPDALLGHGFIRKLVETGRLDRRAGTICGRLLSIGPDFELPATPRIDSTGIYFTPDMRHFDRGWHEPDNGCYRQVEYVFGATAAAALYRREMIRDISIEGEFFDIDFFSYREDADVAWRAQLLGWRCIYNPDAVAWHVRSVVPGNRRSVPAVLNMHSVKNRFLLRIKNTTPGVFRRCWLPMATRDLLVIGGCLVLEQRSLAAFWRLAGCLPRALRRRRAIMARRRVTDDALAAWFNPHPSAQPLLRAVDILPIPAVEEAAR